MKWKQIVLYFSLLAPSLGVEIVGPGRHPAVLRHAGAGVVARPLSLNHGAAQLRDRGPVVEHLVAADGAGKSLPRFASPGATERYEFPSHDR